MTQDPQPNLFAIQDLPSRQAHKLTWDALNALRVEKRALEDSVASLQAQINSVQASSASTANLPAVLSALNAQASISQDHPYLAMSLSVDNSIPDSTTTRLPWDVERFPLAGIHSPTVDNTKVFIGNKPGIWLSVLSVWWNISAVGVRITDVQGSNNLIMNSFRAPGFATAANVQPLTALIITTGANDARGGNYITATVFQNSGGPLTLFGGTDTSTWILYYLAPLGLSATPRP